MTSSATARYEIHLERELDAYRQEEAELHRRLYLERPDLWVEERLGERLWSMQREIAIAVAENRRTAVASCFDSGKSFIASRLACWWIDVHLTGEAIVVSSAPTWKQVRAILWREMRRAHAAGTFQNGEPRLALPGRMNQTEWFRDNAGQEEIVAFGSKPDDHDENAFQGIHERFVLVILDEAAGISASIFRAAEGLIANEESRILAIGNPDDAATEFAEVCKPGSGWIDFHISAFDTPNFTDEDVSEAIASRLVSRIWVEDQRTKYGEKSPWWIAKVLGEFPETREDGLIPLQLIRDAQKRTLEPTEPSEIGADVGGGIDRNVNAHRRGPVVRIVRRDYETDKMRSCGNLIADLEEADRLTAATVTVGKKTKSGDAKAEPTLAKVDEIGIGKGVADRGKELKKPIVGINVGSRAKDPEHFINLRAEGFWGLRERFYEGDIDLDPEDVDVAAQLSDLRFWRTSSGKIQVESKDQIRARNGGASPDEGDAVMLAFLDPPDRKITSAVFRRRRR